MNKPNAPVRWTTHQDPYERYRSAFAASYMSNAKWGKVLGTIAAADLDLQRTVWKFIDADHIYEYGVPEPHDLLPTRLADGRFQPVDYKWIEWIHFPRTWGYSFSQDVEGVKRVLTATAKVHLMEDEQGLTVFGYGK